MTIRITIDIEQDEEGGDINWLPLVEEDHPTEGEHALMNITMGAFYLSQILSTKKSWEMKVGLSHLHEFGVQYMEDSDSWDLSQIDPGVH